MHLRFQDAWWKDLVAPLRPFPKVTPGQLVQDIGNGGQLLGATLLDTQDMIMRPGILPHDGRTRSRVRGTAQGATGAWSRRPATVLGSASPLRC